MKPLRITHIVKTLDTSGVTRVATDLAIGQSSQGHSVRLVALGWNSETADLFGVKTAANLRDRGIGLEILSDRNSKWSLPNQYLGLIRTIKISNDSIIHSHEARTDLLCSALSRRTRDRVVRTLHNTNLYGTSRLVPRLVEHSLRECMVIACSEDVAKAHDTLLTEIGIKLSRKKVVITNGIPAPQRGQSSGLESRSKIGFFGRPDKQKGLEVLLGALIILKSEQILPEVDLFIAGEVSDAHRAALLQLPNVSLFPPAADARNLLDSYRFVAMPSHYEGLPVLALEAMALGVPILATNAPGLREVLPQNWPYIAERGSAESYASVLRQALNETDNQRTYRELTKLSTTKSLEFSLERMLNSYLEQYYAVLPERMM